jgi:hypothetical protein
MSYFTKTDLQGMIKSKKSAIKKLDKTKSSFAEAFDGIEQVSLANGFLKTLNSIDNTIGVLEKQIADHQIALDKLKLVKTKPNKSPTKKEINNTLHRQMVTQNINK